MNVDDFPTVHFSFGTIHAAASASAHAALANSPPPPSPGNPFSDERPRDRQRVRSRAKSPKSSARSKPSQCPPCSLAKLPSFQRLRRFGKGGLPAHWS